LKEFGVNISDQFVSFKSFFTNELTVGSEEMPTGIQMYDKADGTPYCVRVTNNKFNQTPGYCEAAPPTDTLIEEDPAEVIPATITTESVQTGDNESPADTTDTVVAPVNEIPIVEEESAPAVENPTNSDPAGTLEVVEGETTPVATVEEEPTQEVTTVQTPESQEA